MHIFRQTCSPDLHAEPLCTLGSHIWCRPYLHLSPQTCVVLDDGTGRPVGYCLGTSDTRDFCRRWKDEFVALLRREEEEKEGDRSSAGGLVRGGSGGSGGHNHNHNSNSNGVDGEEEEEEEKNKEKKKSELLEIIWSTPEKGCDGDVVGLWDEFPAHLHINLLPDYQRRGWGAQLIGALVERLQEEEEECRGVYLGVGASNTGAVKFYECNGFSRFAQLEQDGEKGRKGGTIIMTKRLP